MELRHVVGTLKSGTFEASAGRSPIQIQIALCFSITG